MLTTDRPMGSIMIAVAVLLTHMLMKAVAIMKPPIWWLGLLPTASNTLSAMRLCRFQRCMASPRTKPPMNRNMVGLAQGVVAWATVRRPSAGTSTLGSREVAGIGIASVDHQ